MADAHSELIVVALPSEYDPVNTLGSEEKHATLLYLGDNVSEDVAALIRAAINGCIRRRGFPPFLESVSAVTSLGKDGARVWMIDSDNGLRMIRDVLLSDPTIRARYDTLEQYPNFIPHMTMGYPTENQTKLAEVIEQQAAQIQRIKFDRIALWYGDDHDIVWRLSPSDMDRNEAGHSETASPRLIHQLLARYNTVMHSGIKGMRWGIRRKSGSDGNLSSTPEAQKAMAAADAERAATSIATIRKSGVKALSNDDLNHLTKRLDLEKKLTNLDPGLLGKTNRKLKRYIGYGDTMQLALAFANSEAGRELSSLIRGQSKGTHATPTIRGQRLLEAANKRDLARKALEQKALIP